MPTREPIYGGVEAGGTKVVCAVARDAQHVLEEQRIETREPKETLAQVCAFFAAMQTKYGALDGLGIGWFGPIQLDRRAADWGHLLATPKPGWTNIDLISPLRSQLRCPIKLDTDVNTAALAEAELGAGVGCRTVAYVTVGTGIGAGVAINGWTLQGRTHPEMGHIYVRRDPRDAFAGSCPFHRDCLEGVASGPAIQQRWGADLRDLPEDHEAHSIVGGYLGQLAGAIMLMISAERIVFGGGVLTNGRLLPHIRSSMRTLLAGYVPARPPHGPAEEAVCLSALQGRAGLLGALLLAKRASVHG